MNGPRKRFSGELKTKVALEAIKGYYTVSEIASQYGVHPNQVTQWKSRWWRPCRMFLRISAGRKKRIMRTSSVSSISRSGS